MKKNLQLAFALTATVVFIFGSGTARSQAKKELSTTVIISNGDTVINGKNLRESAPAERNKLLKELAENEKGSRQVTVRKRKGGKDQDIIIRRSEKEPAILRWQSEDEDFIGDKRVFRFDNDSLIVSMNGDSVNQNIHIRMEGLDSNMRKKIITMHRDLGELPELMDRTRPGMFIERSEMMNRIASRRENSQVFNYVSTDKDGISSRMNIRISEPDAEILKKLIKAETITSPLTVNDLTISPNFSNGKLNLSFNLVDKTAVEVKIMDSSYREVWTDKAVSTTGTYFNQITLPRNGVYFMLIKQGNKSFVRKIIKD